MPDENNEALPQSDSELQMRKMSRRSFSWAVLACGTTYGLFNWLHSLKATSDSDIPPLFRRGLDFDQQVALGLYSPQRLSRTYANSDVTEARVNGDIGIADDFDPSTWKLRVSGLSDSKGAEVSLADIKALPRQEFVTELKCIEGWSIFVRWAGAKFSDFMAKYPPAGKPDYVAMETPDGQYYVSIDMPAAIHPQTLLCYEMNGQPLEAEHGAPLRLVIPHKYGVKNIKRIGLIRFQTGRPRDYWAEQGYDYYAGL